MGLKNTLINIEPAEQRINHTWHKYTLPNLDKILYTIPQNIFVTINSAWYKIGYREACDKNMILPFVDDVLLFHISSTLSHSVDNQPSPLSEPDNPAMPATLLTLKDVMKWSQQIFYTPFWRFLEVFQPW